MVNVLRWISAPIYSLLRLTRLLSSAIQAGPLLGLSSAYSSHSSLRLSPVLSSSELLAPSTLFTSTCLPCLSCLPPTPVCPMELGSPPPSLVSDEEHSSSGCGPRSLLPRTLPLCLRAKWQVSRADSPAHAPP